MRGRRMWQRVSAILGSLTVGMALAVAPVGPVTAQPAEDPAQVRELAERMLANSSSGFGFQQLGSGPRLTARLLPGRVPDGLPINLPVPQGGQIVGSVARTLDGQLASAEVLIDLPGTLGNAQTLYENAFAEQAWSAPLGYSAGGFQQVRTVLPFYRCLGDEWAFAMMTFRQAGSGRIEAQFSFSLAPMTRAGGPAAALTSGPCSAFHTGGLSGGLTIGPPAGSPANRRDLLPALVPPTGSRLQDLGGAMGGDYAVSDATAESTWSAGQLEAHFATQLERAGWVRATGGDAGAVAFSGWLLPHEPSWFGMLTVMETPVPNRYALTVRVETPGSTTGPTPASTEQPDGATPPQN